MDRIGTIAATPRFANESTRTHLHSPGLLFLRYTFSFLLHDYNSRCLRMKSSVRCHVMCPRMQRMHYSQPCYRSGNYRDNQPGPGETDTNDLRQDNSRCGAAVGRREGYSSQFQHNLRYDEHQGCISAISATQGFVRSSVEPSSGPIKATEEHLILTRSSTFFSCNITLIKINSGDWLFILRGHGVLLATATAVLHGAGLVLVQ